MTNPADARFRITTRALSGDSPGDTAGFTLAQSCRFEMPALIAFTAAMVVLLGRGREVRRIHGLLLLAGYALFMAAVLYRGRF